MSPVLVSLTAAYSPTEARNLSGKQGGQWTAQPPTPAEQANASQDEAAKEIFSQLLQANPAQQQQILAGLDSSMLQRVGMFAFLGSGDTQITAIRNQISQALTGRGINPVTVGGKASAAKGAAKKAASKAKSGGSKSSKSSGSKSSGSKAKSSSSKKSTSTKAKSTSSSSTSKAKTTTTTKTTTTKTAPAPPVVSPIVSPTPPPGRGGGAQRPMRASGAPMVTVGGDTAPKTAGGSCEPARARVTIGGTR